MMSVLNATSHLYPSITHHQNALQQIVSPAGLTGNAWLGFGTGNCSVGNSLSAADQNMHKQFENLFVAYNTAPLVNESRLLINHISCRFTMTTNSVSPVPTIAYVYTVRCRRDSPMTALYLFNQGIIAKNFNNIPNTVGLAPLGVQSINATPFDSSLFCKHFIILSAKTYRIAQGDSIQLQLNRRRPPREISSTDINTMIPALGNISPNACLKGWTTGFLVLFRGAPNDAAQYPSVTMTFEMDVIYRFRVLRDSLAHGALQAVSQP